LELRRRDARDAVTPAGSGAGRAIVIGPYLRDRRGGGRARSVVSDRPATARLDEAVGLARAIELEVVEAGIAPLGEINPATFIGKGKVDEFAGVVKSLEAGLVVMDCALSPVQQRNLEKAWHAKVLDRTGLILEIFGRRARTREGALQVELAHLTYQRGRLVRSWTHLERQRGGFGFLGGPGETQIEADRRIIAERIARIKQELEGVKRTRHLHRESRKRVPYPIVALVGYTNAGKSTLFNHLAASRVLSADMLFATLDPTLRAVDLPHGERVILSDTVGFISDLPTTLIAAFRATLEEVIEADLILHVRDVSHNDTDAQSRDVAKVLDELGIDRSDRRLVEVWNKIDRLSEEARERVANLVARNQTPAVLVSAVTGEGLEALKTLIEGQLAGARASYEVTIDGADGAGMSWLYRNAEVLAKTVAEDGRVTMTVRVHPANAQLLLAKFQGRVRAAGGSETRGGRLRAS
jgi:GTP-binding protein HflX